MQVQLQSFTQIQSKPEDLFELSSSPIQTETDSTQIKAYAKTPQTVINISDTPAITIPIYYYRQIELALSPYPQKEPEFSALEVLANEYHGEVEMQIYISSSGEVDQVEVLSTELAASLTSRIVEIFKNMHFDSGKISDQSVPSQIHIITGIRPN